MLVIGASASAADVPRRVALGGGSLTGTVVAADGDAIGDACVSAEANGGWYRTATDGRGRWALTDLPAGPAFLSFNDCEGAVAGYAATRSHELVRRGEVVDDIIVALSPAARIAGRVVGPDSRPVADACISAADDEEVLVGRARTDAEGRFELRSLPPGPTTITARDCTTPATLTAAAAPRVTTHAGATTTVPDLRLGLGGEISGRVTADHTGRAVAGACVTLWTAEETVGASLYRGARTTGTDPLGRPLPDRGRFVFDGVEPGRYRVMFGFDQCSPEDGFDEEFYDDLGPPEMYEPDATTAVIDIGAGGAIAGLDAELLVVPSLTAACFFAREPARPDVPAGSTHAWGVACLDSWGVTTLDPGTPYRPGAQVTRGSLATSVARAIAVVDSGRLVSDPVPAFDDDAGSEHETSLDQLAAIGVLRGTGPRTAQPERIVTRGELATVLARAYAVTTGVPLREDVDRWADSDGSIHEGALGAVTRAGLLVGISPTRIAPAAPLTNAQLATALSRFLDRTMRDLAVAP